jgi:hypothetical protein
MLQLFRCCINSELIVRHCEAPRSSKGLKPSRRRKSKASLSLYSAGMRLGLTREAAKLYHRLRGERLFPL